MHLARTVTHSTLAECQQRMLAREFQYWVAEYKRRPWGDDWLQTGTLAAAVVAPWTRRRVRPDQFIPGAKPAARRRDPKELEMEMQHFAALHNERIAHEERQRAATPPARPAPGRRPPTPRRKR